MAEARGRSWPRGPRPSKDAELPQPDELQLLPLRYQRDANTSRSEAVATLLAQLRLLGFAGVDELATVLKEGQDQVLVTEWPDLAKAFKEADTRVQDVLAVQDGALANGYLLGRGLAESFWALGPRDMWVSAPRVAPAFLFGHDRRRELSRMLGRLKSADIDALTPSTISGSLEAWGAVADSEPWAASGDVEKRLYEQVRRWYQLLILGQDPSTLIKPGSRLKSRVWLTQMAKVFWAQGLLALVGVAVGSGFATGLIEGPEWLTTLLGASGVSAFAVAGLWTKGQAAAQQVLARLRQDAYTDLLAVAVTAVPGYPLPLSASSSREDEQQRARDKAAARTRVEAAVRTRWITPPTAPPRP